MTRKGLSEGTAKKHLEELDRIRARRLKELFKIDWRDPARYDFVLNTARMSVETAAQFIAEVSQRLEYQPTAESLEAIRDLTVNARVQAILITSPDIRLADLEVRTKHGEVQVSGILISEGLERIIVEEVKKVPGVLAVKTHFVVTPPEHYMYGDGR